MMNKNRITGLAAVLAALVVPAMAIAETINVESETFLQSDLPQTATLDLFVTDVAAGQQIIGYQATVEIDPVDAAGTGIEYEDPAGGDPVNHPGVPGIPPIIARINDLRADGGNFAVTGVANLSNDDGLFSVDIIVPAGTPVGVYHVRVNPDPNLTFIVDPNQNNLPLQFIDGQIEIVQIPEPASVAIAGLGFIGVCATWRRRRRA